MMRTIVYSSFVLLLVCWTICDAGNPNPAPVKSRSLIPFPRVGRSRMATQNALQSSNIPTNRERPGMREFKRHLIPFPRVGKRQSLIPFPRVGRSHQYFDDVSYETPTEIDSGLILGNDEAIIPAFDIQDHPVYYGQLRWQQNIQEE